MIWADRLVSTLVFVYVAVAFGADVLAERDASPIIPGAIGLIPCVLLLIPRVPSMLAVTLMSLPCCLGAAMFADATQVPQISDKLLYDFAPFMIVVGVYALARAIQIGITKQSKGEL